MKCHHRWAAALSVAALSLACTASAWAVPYTITDLGVLAGDTYSVGYGINASGQVVGDSRVTNNGLSQPFLN